MIEELRFPLWASPKYDGIRGLVDLRHRLLSRKLKPIPAHVLQKRFSISLFAGIEGELIYGDPVAPDVMQMTTSAVMSVDKDDLASAVKLYVFDCFTEHRLPYWGRYQRLSRLAEKARRAGIILVEQTEIRTIDDLRDYEERIVNRGFEGVMLRDPEAPYKFGRSTLREQYLLKWKRFEDGEAVILGVEEGQRNENEQQLDERGYSKRSKKSEGMVPNGTLGHLIVRDRKNFSGLDQFHIGSGPGLTHELRAELWRDRATLKGQLVKYRFQRIGVKDAPRFPRFMGLRDRRDV